MYRFTRTYYLENLIALSRAKNIRWTQFRNLKPVYLSKRLINKYRNAASSGVNDMIRNNEFPDEIEHNAVERKNPRQAIR
jgi:hypothetical protein